MVRVPSRSGSSGGILRHYAPEFGACSVIPDADVLAMLDPNTILSVQVRAGDLLAAVQRQTGGPEELSTSQAAQLIGRTSAWWRDQASAGRIEGAYMDEVGKWRLPNAAARAYHGFVAQPKAKQSKTRTRSVRRGPLKATPSKPRLVAVPRS